MLEIALAESRGGGGGSGFEKPFWVFPHKYISHEEQLNQDCMILFDFTKNGQDKYVLCT